MNPLKTVSVSDYTNTVPNTF